MKDRTSEQFEYLLGELEAIRQARIDQPAQTREVEQAASKWVHERICKLLTEFPHGN